MDKTGGQAFPSYGFIKTYDHKFGEHRDELVCNDGLTLRDYFAGQALVGLITKAPYKKTTHFSLQKEQIAGGAYSYADAMIAERKEVNP